MRNLQLRRNNKLIMSKSLVRYWFEFDIKIAFNYPPGVGIGCGVTAFNIEDAYGQMDEKIFMSIKRPTIIKTIEHVNISKLDQNHVIPNMGISTHRGIWYPLGYE